MFQSRRVSSTSIHQPIMSSFTAFVQLCPCMNSNSSYTQLRKCSLTVKNSKTYNTSSFYGTTIPLSIKRCRSHTNNQNRVVPSALFGGDGIFGVGTSEVVVILAVGWFVLGPEKLFALAKDTGKVLGQLRRTANDAKETFSEALDYEMMTKEAEKALKEGETEEKTEEEIEKDTEKEVSEADLTPATVLEKEYPVVDTVDPQDTAEEVSEANHAFLEQLKRVADPNQVPPADVPDLSLAHDLEDDEERELKQLEQKYLEARKKVDEKKAKRAITEEFGHDSEGDVR